MPRAERVDTQLQGQEHVVQAQLAQLLHPAAPRAPHITAP